MEIKFIKTEEGAVTPTHATDGSAGVDFYVPESFNSGKCLILEEGYDIVIGLGLKAILPEGTVLLMKNKSGVATKLGLDKGAEVIDCDFRGEIRAHLHNRSNGVVLIKPGMKIIQGVLVPYIKQEWEEVGEEFYEDKTQRGEGGFGSTGTLYK